MKKLFVLLSLIALTSCGANKPVDKEITMINNETIETTTEATTMSEAEFKASCKPAKFKELMETSGNAVELTGKVENIVDGTCRLLVTKMSAKTDHYYDGVICNVLDFKEGDIVKVYGINEGEYKYTSRVGDEITTAYVDVKYSEIIE